MGMGTYRAPVAAIRTALDACGLGDVLALEHFDAVRADDVASVVDGFGSFASDVIAPSDVPGDRFGAVLDHASGRVTVAPEVAAAFEKWVAGGWAGLSAEPEFGGGGLPSLAAIACEEMFGSANLALSLNPMLTQGAIHLLESAGSATQKARYLPGLVSGQWTGTMNLTEPQAGSDVGAVATRAVPNGDGTWAITGQKIFITWGEHDLADNIVHLVLARTPDAPPGTKGISLFIVPKVLLDDARTRNAVRCIGVEHKLGIHSSPTCTLEFDGAQGELVGEVGDGMACMFVMMNAARLSVGLQGLCVTEAAFQQALDYAQNRTQGRAPGASAGAGSKIVEHPDVARMLLSVRSSIDAMRMLLYTTAAANDRARHERDGDARAAAQARADLLTPLAKAWCTDEGVRQTSVALQVHGGMGYVEETGVAQRYRDARIAPIYEGTNGIQAIDLVSRKVRRDRGAALEALLTELRADVAALASIDGLDAGGVTGIAIDALDAVGATAAWIVDAHDVDVLAGATPFLDMCATAVAGALLARLVVHAASVGGDASHVANRFVAFARERLAPVPAMQQLVTAGAAHLDRAAFS